MEEPMEDEPADVPMDEMGMAMAEAAQAVTAAFAYATNIAALLTKQEGSFELRIAGSVAMLEEQDWALVLLYPDLLENDDIPSGVTADSLLMPNELLDQEVIRLVALLAEYKKKEWGGWDGHDPEQARAVFKRAACALVALGGVRDRFEAAAAVRHRAPHERCLLHRRLVRRWRRRGLWRVVQTSRQFRSCRWSIALSLRRNTTPALLQAASASRRESP